MNTSLASNVPRRVVICVPNWLGDSVMAMPAVQAFRKAAPDTAVTVLVKPPLAPLWQMHPAVDATVELHEGSKGAGRAAHELSRAKPAVAYVLPNSFRAALIPMLARIPERVGVPGHRPPGMLNRVVTPPADAARAHQAWEYMAIFGAADAADLEAPRLTIPPGAHAAAAAWLGVEGVWVGLLPGAAYGPAKRWPVAHFRRAAQLLMARTGCRVALLGSRAEASACAEMAAALDASVLNLAGQTPLPELAAVLARCAVVLCNDSGGMHLAAAVGTPVVAVFGITDPGKTGPLGAGHRLVYRDDVPQSRKLERTSPEALAVLASITPERVSDEALAVLQALHPTARKSNS